MFPFKQDLSWRQKNFSKWTNTDQYIVLHHTATWYGSLEGNIKTLLWETPRQVSCHFLINTNWEAYKLGDPKQILWHAGDSTWNWLQWLNSHSVWIEIIGPLTDGWFTKEQKNTVFWLVQHLMAVLNIPKENVIRHKDIAPGRKTDVADTFWNKEFKSFNEWKAKLKPRPYN